MEVARVDREAADPRHLQLRCHDAVRRDLVAPLQGRGLVQAEEGPGEDADPRRDAVAGAGAGDHDELPAIPGAPLPGLQEAGAAEQRELLGEDDMIAGAGQEALQRGEAVGIEGGDRKLQLTTADPCRLRSDRPGCPKAASAS